MAAMDGSLDGTGRGVGEKGAAWPCVISLMGGLLVLIEGLVVAFVGPLLATAGSIRADALLFGVAVIVQGLMIMWASWGLRRSSSRHVVLGTAIVALSMAAMLLAGGGFIIGSVLGIVGGGWAMMSSEPRPQGERGSGSARGPPR